MRWDGEINHVGLRGGQELPLQLFPKLKPDRFGSHIEQIF